MYIGFNASVTLLLKYSKQFFHILSLNKLLFDHNLIHLYLPSNHLYEFIRNSAKRKLTIAATEPRQSRKGYCDTDVNIETMGSTSDTLPDQSNADVRVATALRLPVLPMCVCLCVRMCVYVFVLYMCVQKRSLSSLTCLGATIGSNLSCCWYNLYFDYSIYICMYMHVDMSIKITKRKIVLNYLLISYNRTLI